MAVTEKPITKKQVDEAFGKCFEQILCLGELYDRAKRLALVSVVLSLVAAGIGIAALVIIMSR